MSDPRAASKIRRYEFGRLSPDELPADWLSLASLIFGVVGLIMKYKLAAWLALFACMCSIANMRKQDLDTKQILASILFAVMGLVMNYFGMRPVNQSSG